MGVAGMKRADGCRVVDGDGMKPNSPLIRTHDRMMTISMTSAGVTPSRSPVASRQSVNSATASSPPQTERDLLLSAQKGDQQAFAHIVQSYQRPVYNLCYRMLGNQQEAEDATQETFIRAYTHLDRFNPDRKFLNWVLTIASNHCVDRLRKRRMTTTSLEDDPYVEKVPMPESIDPHLSAERSETSDQVQQWIDQLSPDYRTPVVLLYWYGYSYEEIAQTMGISVSAVKSRLHRARKQIALMIAQTQTAPSLADAPPTPAP